MRGTITILLVTFFSFAAANKNLPSRENQVYHEEDLFVFFERFCRDSSFQIARIKFPLVTVYHGLSPDSTITETLTQDDWKFMMIKKFTSDTFEYYFDSFSNKKLPATDEMVYSIIGIESGIRIYYYFKLIKGRWFLVKTEDLST